MTFESLNLNPKILKALTLAGYKEPTKIQLEAIPKILEGHDIRGSAQTGTGKTAAFLLPALNLLSNPSKGKGPRILILVPTRELAMQIEEQAEKYSKYFNQVKSVCVVGGVPYHAQERKLRKPYDILIATPGRLIDFIKQKKISFPRLEMLVLDEADRMLDMGFVEPVEEIAAKTPDTRQTLLFSATLEGSVRKLSERLLKNPQEIIVHSKKEKHENIEQVLHYTDNLTHKNQLLDHILSQDEIEYAIIFTSTKRHVDELVDELYDKGHVAGALHGDMSQRQRTRTITSLKNGRTRIVVATDVAARGIDVQSITHVINFDLPRNIEDYVHRIGRTGRAGANGTAISFSSHKDSGLVKRIESFTGQPINVKVIEGHEPTGRSKKKGGKRPFSRKRPFRSNNKPSHSNKKRGFQKSRK